MLQTLLICLFLPLLAFSESNIEDYTRAIESNPNDAGAYHDRGRAYYDAEKYNEAIADFSRAIELNPNDVINYYFRADSYYEIGKYDEVIADYTRAIALSPYESAYYNNRGCAYFCQQNYKEASEEFTRAIELAPYESLYYNNRGNTYYHLRQFDEASADYTRGIELASNDSFSYVESGSSLDGGVEALAIDNLATRSGPSTKYRETGTYRVKGQLVRVISLSYDENDLCWVQCEVTDRNKLRRVYTGLKRFDITSFDLDGVPVENPKDVDARAKVTTTSKAQYGPGDDYGAYSSLTVDKGQSVTIITVENGYAQVEWTTSK